MSKITPARNKLKLAENSTGDCVCEEIIKGQRTAENDKHLGLKPLPEHDDAASSLTPENCPQIRVRLQSYGVTFPDRRNFTSSTRFCLSPNTPGEEEEQLSMAKQLCLGVGSISFDDGDNAKKAKEAANTLLSFFQRNEWNFDFVCSILRSLCARLIVNNFTYCYCKFITSFWLLQILSI